MPTIKTDRIPGRQRNRGVKDYTGQKFSKLTAVSLVEREPKWGDHKWLFDCECGNQKIVGIKQAKSGNTTSCGCVFSGMLKDRNRTHGLTKSNPKEYRSWKDMRSRCNNEADTDFPDYGGRGIEVCGRWDDFALFLSDMGPRKAGMTIDRIDVNGNYEPTNCRWADRFVQANNRRSNHLIEMNGRAKTLQAWCNEVGIAPSKVRYRLKQGWPAEKAFSLCDHRKQN